MIYGRGAQERRERKGEGKSIKKHKIAGLRNDIKETRRDRLVETNLAREGSKIGWAMLTSGWRILRRPLGSSPPTWCRSLHFSVLPYLSPVVSSKFKKWIIILVAAFYCTYPILYPSTRRSASACTAMVVINKMRQEGIYHAFLHFNLQLSFPLRQSEAVAWGVPKLPVHRARL